MAAVTIAQIRTNVRAILATYPGIGTDLSTGAALAALPAYEVTSGAGTRTLSGKRWVVTRTVRIWVYGAEVTDPTNETEVRAAFAATEAYIDEFADLIAANPTLKGASDNGLVTGIGALSDNGVGLLYYEQPRLFAGFSLEFTVNVGR